MIVDRHSAGIVATAFATGHQHDFQLLKESRTAIAQPISGLADTGYQGLTALHANSETPAKKSKHHPLTPEQKVSNRPLSQQRMLLENVILKLKIFRLLSERYSNPRKRFALRFNLIATLYNLELDESR